MINTVDKNQDGKISYSEFRVSDSELLYRVSKHYSNKHNLLRAHSIKVESFAQKQKIKHIIYGLSKISESKLGLSLAKLSSATH